MDLSRDASSADEYYLTAVQTFDYCGANSEGTLRVDALMEKFAPFVKTNKAEYSYLQSLLDPDRSNPEISVTKLAKALNKYSDSQKFKEDLDESFHSRSGTMPQDSDSGISSDGYQLLEDLQSELREKTHQTQQLRAQLEFTDRQHEDAMAAIVAEKDTLLAHINNLRDENISLTHARRDCEEACDRLCASEQALANVTQELDVYKKKYKQMQEQVSELDTEKLSLQELLTKSKDECHRINEMYSARQSALREQNETLKAERADLSARLTDQDEFMQTIIKEKVVLEMELKELLNRSNQTQLRLNRSIDVSYTEDQMLTALDTLNADSRFSSENRILDEDSFLDALKEDMGRSTNMSLFDEIRLSTSNLSRQSFTDLATPKESLEVDLDTPDAADILDTSLVTTATQTDDDNQLDVTCCHCDRNVSEQVEMTSIGLQTDESFESPQKHIHRDDRNDLTCFNIERRLSDVQVTSIALQTDLDLKLQEHTVVNMVSSETQTDKMNNNNNCGDCVKCLDCERLNGYAIKLESDLKHSRNNVNEMKLELDKYEENLIILQNVLVEENNRNNDFQAILNYLQSEISDLESVCKQQNNSIDNLSCETGFAESQTDFDMSSVSTQAELPCMDCAGRAAPKKGLGRFVWEPLKCLLQVFAVVSFAVALCLLYGVSIGARCPRGAARVPWRWLHAQDIMDLLLRIEYVADVPM